VSEANGQPFRSDCGLADTLIGGLLGWDIVRCFGLGAVFGFGFQFGLALFSLQLLPDDLDLRGRQTRGPIRTPRGAQRIGDIVLCGHVGVEKAHHEFTNVRII